MNSPNRDCAETRQALHLLLGGELDDSQRRSTESHLDGCAACRAELDEARRSRELYLASAVDVDSEDLDLWPGIRSRLYAEGILQPRTVAASAVPVLRRWAPLAGLAAAAALVMMLSGGEGESPIAPGENPVENIVRPTPVVAETPTEPLLRPVLRGDESLIEREQRLLLERGQDVLNSHPPEPSLYDVVNERRLR